MTSLTFGFASDERVPREARWAAANGIVVDYLTLCSDTAGSRTRVYASLVAAGLILWTVGANRAFRSAGRRRSNVAGHATAHRLFVNYSTDTVRSAGRRVTRVFGS